MSEQKTKKDLEEWYQEVTRKSFDSLEKTGQEQVDIEGEMERQSRQEPEQATQEEPEESPYEDNVLYKEYKNCIQAIGVTEYLRGKLSNYLAMTQVSDFDDLKKEQNKKEIQEIVNELSKTIAEL